MALAGCGGGGGGDGGAAEGGEGAGGGTRGASYDAGYQICEPGLRAVADLYAVEPKRDAVLKLIVEQVSGGRPEDEKAAREGCSAALDKKPQGG